MTTRGYKLAPILNDHLLFSALSYFHAYSSTIKVRKGNDIQFINFCNANLEYPAFMPINYPQDWNGGKNQPGSITNNLWYPWLMKVEWVVFFFPEGKFGECLIQVRRYSAHALSMHTRLCMGVCTDTVVWTLANASNSRPQGLVMWRAWSKQQCWSKQEK